MNFKSIRIFTITTGILLTIFTQHVQAAEPLTKREAARQAAIERRQKVRSLAQNHTKSQPLITENTVKYTSTLQQRRSLNRSLSMRTKRWQELLEKRNARIARRTRSSNWQLPTRSTINSTKAKPSQISKPKGTIDILLDTINGERSKLGLDSLVEHDILARVARSRIKLSIKSRTAVDVSSALESEGYMNVDIHTCNCSAWQYAAMEISAIQETPEGMLVTILADEKNTKRLLSSTYKDIGIALDDTRILIVLGAITFTPIEEFSADQQVQYKKDILELVNKERKQYELQPVKQSDLLEKAAQAHAQDMWDQKYFSHTSMDGRVLEQRIEATGYNTINFETCNCSSWSYRVGENIASGQKDPAAVMEGWMNSAGHRKNILTPEFNELGVGIIGNKWVQNFGVITLE